MAAASNGVSGPTSSGAASSKGAASYSRASVTSVSSHSVERRVGRVRWLPLADATTADIYRTLAIGSTGETTNALTLRTFDTTPNTNTAKTPGMLPSAPIERLGDELTTIVHPGDVNDIRFLSPKLLTTASSTGAIRLFQIGGENKSESKVMNGSKKAAMTLTQIGVWEKLHNGPATCMDVMPATGDDPVVVSSGEDGALHFLQPLSNTKRSIANANSGSTYALRFSGVETLLTVGMGGRMGVWDTRTRSNTPATVCIDPNASSLTALCAHPARPYTVATGSVEGVMSVWDIRASGTPTCSLQAHTSCIWDLVFSPSPSTSIVSCGEDGVLSLWDFNKTKMDPIKVSFSSSQQDNIQPHQLYHNVLPVRALDADMNGRSVICGTDSSSLLSFTHLL